MRLKLLQWIMAGFLLFGLFVPLAFTQRFQFGGGDKGGMGGDKGGKMGGGKMGGGGSDFWFNQMAGKDKSGNQRDVIIIAEYEAPAWAGGADATAKTRETLTAYLAKRGQPTDKMTREQFAGYSEEQQAERSKTMAKSMFDRMDTKKTGKLSKEDIEAGSRGFGGRRSPLLDEFDTYDKNKDGFIDQEEYSAYMTARMSAGRAGATKEEKKEERAVAKEERKEEKKESRGYVAPVVKEAPKADGRPVVYRYGKLPTKDLPSWFTELDTDKDGQVGLYEWRAARRSTAEFKTYDINGDGFIVAEEVLTIQRQIDANKETTAVTYLKVNADPGSDVVGSLGTDSPSKGKGFGKGFGKGGTGEGGGWGKGFGKGGTDGGKTEGGGWGKGFGKGFGKGGTGEGGTEGGGFFGKKRKGKGE